METRKDELIEEIESIINENGEIFFDKPYPIIDGKELIKIGSSYTLEFDDDDDIELEELSEDDLENLKEYIEDQLIADEKVFERCRG